MSGVWGSTGPGRQRGTQHRSFGAQCTLVECGITLFFGLFFALCGVMPTSWPDVVNQRQKPLGVGLPPCFALIWSVKQKNTFPTQECLWHSLCCPSNVDQNIPGVTRKVCEKSCFMLSRFSSKWLRIPSNNFFSDSSRTQIFSRSLSIFFPMRSFCALTNCSHADDFR